MPEYGSDDRFFKKLSSDWNAGRYLKCVWNLGKFVVIGLLALLPILYFISSLNSSDEPTNVQSMENSQGFQISGDNNGQITQNIYRERYSAAQTITTPEFSDKTTLYLDNSGTLVVKGLDNNLNRVTLILNPDIQKIGYNDQAGGELYGYYSNTDLYTFYSDRTLGTRSHIIKSGGRTFEVTLLSSGTKNGIESKKIEYSFGIVEI